MGYFEDLQAAKAAADAAQQVFEKEKGEADLARAQRDATRLIYETLLAQNVQGAIDISQHNWDNGAIDFAAVRAAGYEVLFHKVSDGDVKDKAWFNDPNKATAIRDAGLVLGNYYFARIANPGNSQRNGKSEAAMAVYFAESRGAIKPGDLPLAYDFENESIMGQTPQKCAKHLMEFVRTYHYIKGTPPILYTNPSTWNTISSQLSSDDKAFLGTCPLWQAQYEVSTPDVLMPWSGWTFWQYTSTGSVPGIVGSVDINKFSGDKAALQALRIQPT